MTSFLFFLELAANGLRYPLVGGIGHHPGALPGRDNATLAEPSPSRANCLKTRRVPQVVCTPCWLAFGKQNRLKKCSLFSRLGCCSKLERDFVPFFGRM